MRWQMLQIQCGKNHLTQRREQLPEIFHANFSFPDGASVVFKEFNFDLVDDNDEDALNFDLVDDNDEDETDQDDELDLLAALDFDMERAK